MFLILFVYVYHSLCVCRVQKRKIVVGLISCIESRSIILLFECVLDGFSSIIWQRHISDNEWKLFCWVWYRWIVEWSKVSHAWWQWLILPVTFGSVTINHSSLPWGWLAGCNVVATDEACQELLVAHRHLQSLSWLDNWMMGCREMVVVHPDVNFLDDITGQLGEVPSFSNLYAILSYLCSVVTELMLLTFLAPLLRFLSFVWDAQLFSLYPTYLHVCKWLVVVLYYKGVVGVIHWERFPLVWYNTVCAWGAQCARYSAMQWPSEVCIFTGRAWLQVPFILPGFPSFTLQFMIMVMIWHLWLTHTRLCQQSFMLCFLSFGEDWHNMCLVTLDVFVE